MRLLLTAKDVRFGDEVLCLIETQGPAASSSLSIFPNLDCFDAATPSSRSISMRQMSRSRPLLMLYSSRSQTALIWFDDLLCHNPVWMLLQRENLSNHYSAGRC